MLLNKVIKDNHHRIGSCQEENIRLEEEMLSLYEEIEDSQNVIRELNSELVELDCKYKVLKAQFDEADCENQKKISALEKELTEAGGKRVFSTGLSICTGESLSFRVEKRRNNYPCLIKKTNGTKRIKSGILKKN